jgi:hypothetical protein
MRGTFPPCSIGRIAFPSLGQPPFAATIQHRRNRQSFGSIRRNSAILSAWSTKHIRKDAIGCPSRIEPLPAHNAETGQRFSHAAAPSLTGWLGILLLSRRGNLTRRCAKWQLVASVGVVAVVFDLLRGDNDPLTVLPSPCEQRLSDVLDLSRVAILLVAAALGRLVRHVPSAVELFVELHVLRRMVVLLSVNCGR